jgi:hypothetical protein
MTPVARSLGGCLKIADAEMKGLRHRLQELLWPPDKTSLILLLVAIAVSAALRSIRLSSLLPVLVDEAIYMRWAEIIQHQHTWFISLLDAKPPLIYWLYAGIRFIVPHDPLFGSRAVSVCAGVLTTLALFRVGHMCAGYRAGLVAAFLYAVFPFGVLYDRLAYVDSVVNLCGVCLVATSLSAFANELIWRRTLVSALVLGISMLIKTTILLFGLAPLVIGLYLQSRKSRLLLMHLIAVYAAALPFPLLSHFAVPVAPFFPYNDWIFHHTSFFTPLSDLLTHPLVDLRPNIRLLGGYARAYIGTPTLIASMIAMIALLIRRRFLPILIFLVASVPFFLVLSCLQYFPSRYLFPLTWPLLLAIACVSSTWSVQRGCTVFVYLLWAATGTSMLSKSARILRDPVAGLQEQDAAEFLGPGPYSGSGVLEAIAMMRKEGEAGPTVILTDPWWGPPTDAVFAYLNLSDGIRVYEAWWLQLGTKYPLLPSGSMPVWKSQYERVESEQIDFSKLSRVYFITDSAYHTPKEVHAMAPSAQILKRFPKRTPDEFIDLYLLR